MSPNSSFDTAFNSADSNTTSVGGSITTTITALTPTPTLASPRPKPARCGTWIIYDKETAPALGSRVHGYIRLASGHLFTDWGTGTKATTLRRMVVVKPIKGQRDKLTPVMSMEKDMEMDITVPTIGSEANGFWEPGPNAGEASIIHFGFGEVLAVYEDVSVYEVRRAGNAVHPEIVFWKTKN